MKQEFELWGFSPLSVNSTYVRGQNGVTKSQDAREWFQEACFLLGTQENSEKLKLLREAFNPKLHYYSFTIFAIYPEKELITRKGEMSARAKDCSNFEKSILDVFMLPKFFTEAPPYGCPNLNIDDRYVGELRSYKARGKQAGIKVRIEVKELSQLPSLV